MSKDPQEYLKHIYDECTFIISVTENLSILKKIIDV